MLKIAYCSDLHLEFGPLTIKNTEKADVLILSGDICIASDLSDVNDSSFLGRKNVRKYHSFFQNVSAEFTHVIYIMGNHEHYHGDFNTSYDRLKEHLAYLPNIHVMEKEIFDIGKYLFIGGTLWTDMNKEDPITMVGISAAMNDFRCVKNSTRMVGSSDRPAVFTPEDAVTDHKAFLQYISDQYQEDMINIVVGHHTPSPMSVHPKYKGDYHMNGGYHSDLSKFILARPQIKLWTHGHTHEPFDYMIGETRVVCNPRGYINYEAMADSFELKYVEI